MDVLRNAEEMTMGGMAEAHLGGRGHGSRCQQDLRSEKWEQVCAEDKSLLSA